MNKDEEIKQLKEELKAMSDNEKKVLIGSLKRKQILDQIQEVIKFDNQLELTGYMFKKKIKEIVMKKGICHECLTWFELKSEYLVDSSRIDNPIWECPNCSYPNSRSDCMVTGEILN